MQIQTLRDGHDLVFAVTDLLRGVRYFVADRGSHYEIEVPRKAGRARIPVSQRTDVVQLADELIRLLDGTD